MRELVFRMVAENPTWGEELRCRMPELRKQQRANEAELQSLEMTAVDPTRNLRLVETLAEFRARLRARGNVLEVADRQRVVRLLVHEILVGRDNITIRHSIPMPASSPDPNDRVRPSREPPKPNPGSCYLLRSHGQHAWDNVLNCWFPETGCRFCHTNGTCAFAVSRQWPRAHYAFWRHCFNQLRL